MPDMHTRRRELEEALTALVNSLAADIDAKNLDLLRDFIENREFGVALEWLISLLRERSVTISQNQKQEIKRLADLMHIDLRDQP